VGALKKTKRGRKTPIVGLTGIVKMVNLGCGACRENRGSVKREGAGGGIIFTVWAKSGLRSKRGRSAKLCSSRGSKGEQLIYRGTGKSRL